MTCFVRRSFALAPVPPHHKRTQTNRAERVTGFGRVVVCAVALGAVVGVWSSVAAASAKSATARSVRSVNSGALASRSTSILGAAWKADNSPIPNAKLRLRNVLTGRIEATTVANEAGQFAFTGIESGTYAIELVSDTGKVLTLGHTFTVAPGETVATFVRLGTRVPWFNGFFGNAAAAASSTAASTGVTAIAPTEVRPASGRQ
jgi:hypothetical protein